LERGKLKRIIGVSVASQDLKVRKVAERQKETIEKILEEFNPEIEVVYDRTICPGSGIAIWAEFENTILGSDIVGEKGKPAEQLGREVAERMKKYLESKACLDKHLADQILPFLALACENGESKVHVAEITKHCLTNIWVIEKFLPVKFSVEGEVGKEGVIKVEGVEVRLKSSRKIR
jgi:RNA 3'-terminal phosphate cyclase